MSSADATSHRAVDIRSGDGITILLSLVPTSVRHPLIPADPGDAARHLQLTEPIKWAMTLAQFADVVAYIVNTAEYAQVKATKGFISVYDVNSLYVQPWTATLGCGVALCLNANAPKEPQVMLSHVWAADLEETMQHLREWADESCVAWQQDAEELRVWYCCFANYQANDTAGPTVKAPNPSLLHQTIHACPLLCRVLAGAVWLHFAHAPMWHRPFVCRSS